MRMKTKPSVAGKSCRLPTRSRAPADRHSVGGCTDSSRMTVGYTLSAVCFVRRLVGYIGCVDLSRTLFVCGGLLPVVLRHGKVLLGSLID